MTTVREIWIALSAFLKRNIQKRRLLFFLLRKINSTSEDLCVIYDALSCKMSGKTNLRRQWMVKEFLSHIPRYISQVSRITMIWWQRERDQYVTFMTASRTWSRIVDKPVLTRPNWPFTGNFIHSKSRRRDVLIFNVINEMSITRKIRALCIHIYCFFIRNPHLHTGSGYCMR